MKLTYISLIIIVLLISGCSTIQFKNLVRDLPGMPQFNQEITSKSGYIGYSSSFKGPDIIIRSPYTKVLFNLPMEIYIVVQNKGEAPASGSVCIQGLDETFEGYNGCECQSIDIYGYRAQKNSIPELGGEEHLKFGPFTPKNKDITSHTLSTETRFDYYTRAKLNYCLKENIYGSEGCQIAGEKMISPASAGPLRITSISEQITPSKSNALNVVFTISVTDSGEGLVISHEENIIDCKPSIGEAKISVRMYNAPGSAPEISCSPIIMKDKKSGTSICKIEDVPPADLSDESIIELKYAYQIVKNQKFDIINVE